MRIALDATPLILTCGGLHRYVTELAVALAREFPEDEYLLLSDQKFGLPAEAPPNLAQGANHPAARRWWLLGLPRTLREQAVQVFHGTNFEVPYAGKTPAILTIHDLSPWRNPEWHHAAERVRRRTPWLVRLRRAERILTVSEAARREIIQHFGVRAEFVRAVPLAAASFFRPVTVTPPQKPFFLYVGALEPRKNLPALVEAWRATRDETGAELRLVGRSRKDFVPPEPAEGLNLVGEVPDCDLPGLYSQALAFVYPTSYEGFGLPVLEAMQCGCPVITSHDPAVKEVAGGAALHAGTVTELAQAMRSVSANPALREQLRQAGLARAAQFSWARTARETRALYAEVAGAAR